MIIDSHCHLDRIDLSQFNGDLTEALKFAASYDVQYFLTVCVDMETFPQTLAIAKQHPQVFASVGLHPTEIVDSEPSVEELINLGQDKKIIAVGETGLDYYRIEGDITWQQERFRKHIQAAKALNKPLIVHTRQARADTIRILQEENAAEVGGVLHCFTEDWEMAKQALDIGFYISFSGIITFKNAEEIREVARQMPLDRILIETDAPYLAPVPYRGKPNQPAYVRYVAEYLAQLRDLPLSRIGELTSNNFFQLFKHAKN